MLTARELPTLRVAPPEITRALKEVDPTAELVYFGDGRWDLLRLRPKNDDRALVAQKMLAGAVRACQIGRLAEHGWYRALRFARLVREGYVVFGRWRLMHDPDWRIVQDFRRAMWEYRHDHNDETIEARWDGGRQAKAAKLRAELASLDRAKEATKALRHAVTYSVNGFRGAA